MANDGPTADELAAAKSYLKGAYALSLDSSAKIAAQLTQIQLDNLGIDYIQRRSTLIDAVTVADTKRVAQAPLQRRHAGDRGRPAQGSDLERTE